MKRVQRGYITHPKSNSKYMVNPKLSYSNMAALNQDAILLLDLPLTFYRLQGKLRTISSNSQFMKWA